MFCCCGLVARKRPPAFGPHKPYSWPQEAHAPAGGIASMLGYSVNSDPAFREWEWQSLHSAALSLLSQALQGLARGGGAASTVWQVRVPIPNDAFRAPAFCLCHAAECHSMQGGDRAAETRSEASRSLVVPKSCCLRHYASM